MASLREVLNGKSGEMRTERDVQKAKHEPCKDDLNTVSSDDEKNISN